MRIAIAGLILLAACAQQPREEVYVDLTGQGRTVAHLDADVAACEWQVTQLRSGPVVPIGDGPLAPVVGALASNPPPNALQQCLAARGWRLDEVR